MLVILCFLVAGLTLFVIIPGVIFSYIQDWTYFESIYFCFVTLTTVGFGDFVPGIDGSNNGFYRVCVAFWIFIGLAFLSLVISLLQETFTKITRKVQDARCKCLPTETEDKNEIIEETLDKALDEIISDNIVSD